MINSPACCIYSTCFQLPLLICVICVRACFPCVQLCGAEQECPDYALSCGYCKSLFGTCVVQPGTDGDECYEGAGTCQQGKCSLKVCAAREQMWDMIEQCGERNACVQGVLCCMKCLEDVLTKAAVVCSRRFYSFKFSLFYIFGANDCQVLIYL